MDQIKSLRKTQDVIHIVILHVPLKYPEGIFSSFPVSILKHFHKLCF